MFQDYKTDSGSRSGNDIELRKQISLPFDGRVRGNVIDLREIRVTKGIFFLHPPLTPPIKGGEFYESPTKIEIFSNFINHLN